jgi:hypothetical protein
MPTLANRRFDGQPLIGAMLNNAQRTAGFDSRPGKEANRMESACASVPRSIHVPATGASWAAPATRIGT